MKPWLRRALCPLAGMSCLMAVAACTGGDGLVLPAYMIEGVPVMPSETMSVVASATGDVNGDGIDDHAAVLMQNSAGSGVFYHLNVFVGEGKNGMILVGEDLLGDRIAFDQMRIYSSDDTKGTDQSVPIHPDDVGVVMVAFFVYSSGQAFTDEPAFYITRRWKVENGALVGIDQY